MFKLSPLTHCPLKPFGTHIQITVEANVAQGVNRYRKNPCVNKLAGHVV